MELDDLKTAWRELDRKLDDGRALDLQVLRELKLDKTRSALRRLTAQPLMQLLLNGCGALLLGSFLGDHLATPRYAIPALILHAAVLLLLAADLRQLVRLARIDWAAPVVQIQRSLAALRAERIRATQLTLLAAPLLWTPLAIVAAEGLLGFDLYLLGPAVIATNLAFGLAVIPLGLWIARHLGRRLSPSFLQRLADNVAGRSLAVAQGHLEEISRFEDER
jgi:hypothetical protein